MYKNIRFSKKSVTDRQTYIHTYIHTDKVIHRGAPLLKILHVQCPCPVHIPVYRQFTDINKTLHPG